MITVRLSGFAEAARGLADLTTTPWQAVMRQKARAVMREVVAITPPGSGRGVRDAKASGVARVRIDLGKLFVAVRLKGRRPEAWPDVAGLHRTARDRRGRVLSDRRQKYYVDRGKVMALRKKKEGMVGYLASAWARGAAALQVRLPAYAARHAASGTARLNEGSGFSFRAENRAPFGQTIGDVQRRVDWAMEKVMRGTEKQIEAVFQKQAKKAGLTWI